ncbi:MAG: tetratricopeptide repeat protein [Verrucomicrobiota bacterium]|nr:tetratricopeptide repeat protein [Verrucomicrobiota bacterium]
MKRLMMVLAVLAVHSGVKADDLSDMKKEIEALKRDVAELKVRVLGETEARADRKDRIRKRFDEDKKAYSAEQFREIETLYQSANRDLKNPEAKAALKALIEKYPKANRTGCAVQYIGQMSQGEEQETYLKLAIKDFSDCYYGDGVQVGAYARFCLGSHYKEIGKDKEAKALFDEIRKDYPDAVNHKGKPLAELLPN